MEKDKIRKSVYDFYNKVAKEDEKISVDVNNLNRSLGYSEEDLSVIPEEAQLGLGCGNPKEKGKPMPGEIVADLGCGRGMDVFLASKAVKETGKVVGIDSNIDMIERARKIARDKGFANAEFRLGEIEHLPASDNTFDLLMSNCVINLSTDKEQVYKEIYRVLKKGGRLSISDIALKSDLPDEIKDDPNVYGT
ncbi:MAG: methyltransferase domain-containing protein [Gudongella sp.]|jgi:SAM-dependent methyltransferase|nr:methyltransferase domain-containing protein [Gudongella sp.]